MITQTNDQARDGLEPCPRDELVRRLQQLARQQADGTDFHNGRALHAEDTMYWKAAKRIEADQSSLDTMAGRIEDDAETIARLREALERFTGQAVFDPHTRRVSVDEFVVEKARAALRGEQP